LRRCHPGMLVALGDLHRALAGGAAPEQVVQWLVETSGLSLKNLQNLYSKQRDPISPDASITSTHGLEEADLSPSQTQEPEAGASVGKAISRR